MERIGDEIRRELRRFGPQARLAEVLGAWPAAVGREMARNACPARFARDGTLHVATTSSAWAFELTNLQRVVADRLRAALGEDAPSRVVFAPGPVPELPAAPAPDRRRPSAVPASALARGAELAAAVSDEELARRVAAAAAAAFARTSADRRF